MNKLHFKHVCSISLKVEGNKDKGRGERKRLWLIGNPGMWNVWGNFMATDEGKTTGRNAITRLEEKVDWVKEIKTFRNKVVDGKVAYTREESETPLSFGYLRVMFSVFLWLLDISHPGRLNPPYPCALWILPAMLYPTGVCLLLSFVASFLQSACWFD